jgi:hypothetical protein
VRTTGSGRNATLDAGFTYRPDVMHDARESSFSRLAAWFCGLCSRLGQSFRAHHVSEGSGPLSRFLYVTDEIPQTGFPCSFWVDRNIFGKNSAINAWRGHSAKTALDAAPGRSQRMALASTSKQSKTRRRESKSSNHGYQGACFVSTIATEPTAGSRHAAGAQCGACEISDMRGVNG